MKAKGVDVQTLWLPGGHYSIIDFDDDWLSQIEAIKLAVKIQDLDASGIMDWLGNDFPFSENALSGKHAIVCGIKGIGKAT